MTAAPRPAESPRRVRIREVPASAGLAWIRRGFRAFLRQPGGFMGMFGMFLLTVLVFSVPLSLLAPLFDALGLDPVLIQLLGVVLMPLLSLGFMVATEAVTNDLRVRPRMFFAPLARPAAARWAIAEIGFVYVAVLAGAYFFGNGLDDGGARDWFGTRLAPQSAADLMNPKPLSDASVVVLAAKMAILALGSVPLWHAPALVHWGRQRTALALFSSVVALWRTRGAMTLYLLGWAAVMFGVSLAFGIVAILLQGTALVMVLALTIAWVLSAVFYVSLWFGFDDTFDIAPDAARPGDANRTDRAAG